MHAQTEMIETISTRKDSQLEAEFASQVRRFRLPPPLRNYQFAKDEFGRKWELDFAWESPYRLGVELNGMVVDSHNGRRVDIGGHGTVVGIVADQNKCNAAILLGWAILRFSQRHVISSHDAIDMTQRALVVRGWEGPQ